MSRRLLTLGLSLVVAVSVGLAALRPPNEDAAMHSYFELDAALRHLDVIAAVPHPSGSAANHAVRDYLLGVLEGLGFDAIERQVAVVPLRDPVGRPGHGEITNILARRRGTPGGRAVLFMVHYDSRHGAPGAGDDGAAVAALLECLRCFSDERDAKNDLMVLLTDGEEAGLLGARAFVGEPHPWFRDVAVVFNFEGRGSSGPAWMFETGRGNAEVVRRWLASASHPMGSSLMTAIYRSMPNATDFSVFLGAGVQGLNFAFIGGHENYHQPTDTVDRLDRRSLVHHATNMLALWRSFRDVDLAEVETTDDLTYFNLTSTVAVSYSSRGVWPLAGLAALAFAGLVWRARRRGDLTVGRGLIATAALAVLAILVALVGFVICQVVLKLAGGYRWFPWGFTTHDHLWFIGLAALGTFLAVVGAARLARAVGPAATCIGALALFVGATLAAAAFVPGGAYLFTWPAILLTAVAHGTFRRGRSWPRATALTGLLVVAFYAPIILAFFQGMMLGMAAVALPIASLALFPVVGWLAECGNGPPNAA